MLRERQRKGMRFGRCRYVGPEGPTYKTTADPAYDLGARLAFRGL